MPFQCPLCFFYKIFCSLLLASSNKHHRIKWTVGHSDAVGWAPNVITSSTRLLSEWTTSAGSPGTASMIKFNSAPFLSTGTCSPKNQTGLLGIFPMLLISQSGSRHVLLSVKQIGNSLLIGAKGTPDACRSPMISSNALQCLTKHLLKLVKNLWYVICCVKLWRQLTWTLFKMDLQNSALKNSAYQLPCKVIAVILQYNMFIFQSAAGLKTHWGQNFIIPQSVNFNFHFRSQYYIHKSFLLHSLLKD